LLNGLGEKANGIGEIFLSEGGHAIGVVIGK
jgi:hypothetical protein